MFLLSLVYLLVKIRQYFTDKGDFKFTVNYLIDTGSENSEPPRIWNTLSSITGTPD